MTILGISSSSVEVLGILRCNWSEVWNMTGVAVTPVVGFIGSELTDKLDRFKPNPDEVECLFTVTLEELLDQENWDYGIGIPIRNGENKVHLDDAPIGSVDTNCTTFTTPSSVEDEITASESVTSGVSPVFNAKRRGNGHVIWGLTAYLLDRFIKDVLLKCSIVRDKKHQVKS
jgi:hypothetical protein